jgi:hypothetical protein
MGKIVKLSKITSNISTCWRYLQPITVLILKETPITDFYDNIQFDRPEMEW